jgi:DnaJ domain
MMPVPESADRSIGSGVAPKKRPVHSSVVADAEPPEAVAALPQPTSEDMAALPEPSEDESETTTLLPVLAEDAPLATVGPGPELKADPGLYAVLGLDPAVSDIEIQTTYRRQAARLLGNGSNDTQALKQLNVAYEVLGNPVRRAEYDRLRLSQSLSPGAPTPIRPGAKATTRITKRRRPRHAVQPRYAGIGDVLVVLVVVGLAVVAGALLIPRLSINLSALNALQSVLPLSNSSRRVIDTSATPVPATPLPTATPLPGVAARFVGSNVSVSNPTPGANTPENVIVHLRRDGKPAANFDVWATVKYRTVEERWPATGSVKTDANGTATITFNVGGATPNFPVNVNVFAQVDDQQLSWSTSFTPH